MWCQHFHCHMVHVLISDNSWFARVNELISVVMERGENNKSAASSVSCLPEKHRTLNRPESLGYVVALMGVRRKPWCHAGAGVLGLLLMKPAVNWALPPGHCVGNREDSKAQLEAGKWWWSCWSGRLVHFLLEMCANTAPVCSAARLSPPLFSPELLNWRRRWSAVGPLTGELEGRRGNNAE